MNVTLAHKRLTEIGGKTRLAKVVGGQVGQRVAAVVVMAVPDHASFPGSRSCCDYARAL